MGQIVEITKDSPPEHIETLKGMFKGLYDGLRRYGVYYDLAEGGEEDWANLHLKMAGSLGIILGYVEDGKLLGFTNGHLKTSPSFFGGKKVGVWKQLYVDSSLRGTGAAEELMRAAEEWFKEKGVDSIEGDVLLDNEPARKYLKRYGYEDDYIVLRKQEF